MDNWSNIELLFTLKLNITPDKLDQLEFWRIESLLDKYEEYIKKENEGNSKTEKEYENKYKFDTPKMDNLKMPEFNVPNLSNYGGFNMNQI